MLFAALTMLLDSSGFFRSSAFQSVSATTPAARTKSERNVLEHIIVVAYVKGRIR